MPVHSIKNQYRGINAHLHSYYQAEGGWAEFHVAHIVSISTALKAALFPLGYTVGIQSSLQIRRLFEDDRHPESDVLIYDLDSERARQSASLLAVPQAATLSAIKLLHPLSEKPYQAVTIHRRDTSSSTRGEAIVWIELLSPSNKGKGHDAQVYREKRQELLESGITFMEIDYLNETPSTFHGIDQLPAHTYRIYVIQPLPGIEDGIAYTYGFNADDPISPVVIPLSGQDRLEFDFYIPYTRAYEDALLGLEFVDYAELPLHFDRYTLEDQARIVNRMIAVLEAAQRSDDLNAGTPFSTGDLPLAAALEKLKMLQ
ncbi:MAG: DUF4058 family protein [Anaerolineae bacterium]